uniref:Putative secreted protein n=1 Tax=Ixodes ricinus TaxID=34613 RepID=A0A6B0UBQ7_IXORI
MLFFCFVFLCGLSYESHGDERFATWSFSKRAVRVRELPFLRSFLFSVFLPGNPSHRCDREPSCGNGESSDGGAFRCACLCVCACVHVVPKIC